MDFIVDNYFWFIVGGIVVLMIIIGYIAEKTDFGRKPFKEKKVNNKETNVTNAEEPEVIPETDSSSQFMMENGPADVELPEDVVNEDDIEDADQIQEKNEEVTFEEPIETVEDAVDEPIADLDIPEITTGEEITPEVSDVVEEVITDDSEDDVWKF